MIDDMKYGYSHPFPNWIDFRDLKGNRLMLKIEGRCNNNVIASTIITCYRYNGRFRSLRIIYVSIFVIRKNDVKNFCWRNAKSKNQQKADSKYSSYVNILSQIKILIQRCKYISKVNGNNFSLIFFDVYYSH